jgi:acetyltransferase-like isoleucine patch superfamily enzyme
MSYKTNVANKLGTHSFASEFERSSFSFLRFLQSVPVREFPAVSKNSPTVGVVVGAWCSTTVPWYSIAMVFLLRQRGINTIIIWDDLLDVPNSSSFHQETAIIGNILSRIQGFPIIRLSKLNNAPIGVEDEQFMWKRALENAIWWNKGSLPIERVRAAQRSLFSLFSSNISKVRAVFDSANFDFVVMPGGTFGNSGLFLRAGAARGVRVSTYDSGEGSAMLGLNGVAATCSDVPHALQRMNAEMKRSEIHEARAYAREFLLNRMEGRESLPGRKDGVQSQVQTVKHSADKSRYSYKVVIPLNIEWDSAALGLHTCFETDVEWVEKTVEYLLKHTNVSVAVREHPLNRKFQQGESDIERLLTSKFGDHPQFKFFSKTSQVNSYRLLEQAKVILPHTSTIGIEAAMLGKKVIIQSKSYYRNQPFVEATSSQSEYFHAISHALNDESLTGSASPEAIQAAELTYFARLAYCIHTDFTPQPKDFETWSNSGFNQLSKNKDVACILESLIANVPTACLQKNQITSKPATTANGEASLTELFPDVSFGESVQVLGLANVAIGSGSCIADNVWLNVCVRDKNTRMKVGRCCLIGRHSMISTGGYLEIGDYCLFGPRVNIVDADHGFADITRPYGEQRPTLNRSIIVEENCWFAVGVVVAGHLTIGRGSVIGANAVVPKTVPPFSVVVGHPGRVVKMYNPLTKSWERADSESDRQRIENARKDCPLPTREEYRRILAQNSTQSRINPVVAGNSICI